MRAVVRIAPQAMLQLFRNMWDAGSLPADCVVTRPGLLLFAGYASFDGRTLSVKAEPWKHASEPLLLGCTVDGRQLGRMHSLLSRALQTEGGAEQNDTSPARSRSARQKPEAGMRCRSCAGRCAPYPRVVRTLQAARFPSGSQATLQ